MIASEPLPHFVDDLLGYLHETHPTHATLDGVHTHDDLLEDLSRQGIDGEAHALSGYLRRLDEINRDALTPVERLEHRMLTVAPPRRGCSSSKRSARGSATRSSTRTSSRRAWPDRRCSLTRRRPSARVACCRNCGRRRALIQAARDNIKDPPGIFVKVGIETMRGALKFIDDELPRAFASVDDLHLLGDLADAQTEASHAVGAYIEYLETELAPEGARLVPPRSRQVRAEAAARRRDLASRSIACWRSPHAS